MSGKPKGRKFDQGKDEWYLMPWPALRKILRVLMYGAKKYEPFNWKHVSDPKTRYINATLRHLIAYAEGEEIDPESGHHHLAHAGCNILFLLSYQEFAKVISEKVK